MTVGAELCAAILLVIPACATTEEDWTLETRLVVVKSGGIQGAMDRLVISRQGEYSVTRRGEVAAAGKLEADRVRTLSEILKNSGLFDQDREFNAEGADLSNYRFSYRGHTVVAMENAPVPGLRPILDLLDPLLRRRK